jgi:hypothetical protein
MITYHNIEKSAFRAGEYVGYAGDVWRIRKCGYGGWEARRDKVPNTPRDPLYLRTRTLREMSAELARIASEHMNCRPR